MSKPIKKTKTGRKSASGSFILSTEAVDRDGDVIRAKGWSLDKFRKNPVALFGHDHGFPIGTWANVKVSDGRLLGDFVPAEKGTSERVDEINSLIDQGILNAVSVGFAVHEYDILDGEKGGFEITSQELLEASIVSVPANQEALRIAKGLGVSRETREIVFGAAKGAKLPPATGHPKSIKRKANTMALDLDGLTLTEKVAALNTRRDEVTKATETMADLPVEEIDGEALEALASEAADLDAQIKNFSTIMRVVENGKASPKPTARKAGARPVAPAMATAKTMDKKDAFDHFIASIGVAAQATRKHLSIEEAAARFYPNMHEGLPELTKRYVYGQKSATAPANSTTVGWAAELMETRHADFVWDLAAGSVLEQLRPGAAPLNFEGNNAIFYPTRSAPGSVAGGFVGEGATIPVKQDILGGVSFDLNKLAVIVTCTDKVMNSSSFSDYIRRAISEDTQALADAKFTNPAVDAMANVRPASPWYGATNQASQDIEKDLNWLAMQMTNARVPKGTTVYVMSDANYDEALNKKTALGTSFYTDADGSLNRRMVAHSPNVPNDWVGVCHNPSLAIGGSEPEFDIQNAVTLAMADDDGVAPTMASTDAVTTAGSIKISDAAGTTPQTVVRSMWQEASFAIRMYQPISYGPIRAGAFAYVTGVDWHTSG